MDRPATVFTIVGVEMILVLVFIGIVEEEYLVITVEQFFVFLGPTISNKI